MRGGGRSADTLDKRLAAIGCNVTMECRSRIFLAFAKFADGLRDDLEAAQYAKCSFRRCLG